MRGCMYLCLCILWCYVVLHIFLSIFMYICAREVWWGHLPLERLRVFLPNCSPGEDFAKNIESAFWQGEQIKTKLANYWQMWEKIGKNIFVIALIMGWRYRTLSGRWAGHHLPVGPSGLFRLIRMGGSGEWGGLNWPLLLNLSYTHQLNTCVIWWWSIGGQRQEQCGGDAMWPFKL